MLQGAFRAAPRIAFLRVSDGVVALNSTLELMAGVVGVCAVLPPRFALVLALYVTLSVSYTIWLKRKMLVDVFVLAGLYTLRLLAGGQATAVDISRWLLAFSIFFFLGLAFNWGALMGYAAVADTLAAEWPLERFDGRLDYTNMRGQAMSLPFAATLAHVFNHGTHHRGQITAALTFLGQAGPELDLVYFLQQNP